MNGRAVRWLLSLAHRPAGAGGSRLTIVRHHRVYEDHERPLYRLGVRRSMLAAQIDLLASLGSPPITVAEGLARLDAGEPGHWVAFTFDDGYADNVTAALPLLAQAGARATFYLTAGWIERREPAWWDVLAHALESTAKPRLATTLAGAAVDLPLGSEAERRAALDRLLPLFRAPLAERAERLARLRAALAVTEPAPCAFATWEQAAALARAGMEVGAHTLSHPHLTTLSPSEQEAEIAGSVETIERRLGHRPGGLAYPGGDHDARTAAIAEAAGLAHAVTTRPGDNGPRQGRWTLLRRGLSEGACIGPLGGFSRRLARAELDGAFDRLRGVGAAS